MEFKHIANNFLLFLKSPVGFFKELIETPDVVGGLLFIDLLAFLLTVLAVIRGSLQFSWTFSFVIGFVVLYLLLFILIAMLVGFEAGYAVFLSRLFDQPALYWSLFTAMAYSRIPLIVGTVVYMFLPAECTLQNIILSFSDTPDTFIRSIFMQRIEFFEIITLIFGMLAAYVLTGMNKKQTIAVVASGWIISTALFYYVQTVLI